MYHRVKKRNLSLLKILLYLTLIIVVLVLMYFPFHFYVALPMVILTGKAA